MEEVCERFVFVLAGSVREYPDFRSMLEAPNVRTYLGRLASAGRGMTAMDRKRLCVVTGAAGVVGAAVSRQLVADGYRVLMMDHAIAGCVRPGTAARSVRIAFPDTQAGASRGAGRRDDRWSCGTRNWCRERDSNSHTVSSTGF